MLKPSLCFFSFIYRKNANVDINKAQVKDFCETVATYEDKIGNGKIRYDQPGEDYVSGKGVLP